MQTYKPPFNLNKEKQMTELNRTTWVTVGIEDYESSILLKFLTEAYIHDHIDHPTLKKLLNLVPSMVFEGNLYSYKEDK